jgi:plastocyanin
MDRYFIPTLGLLLVLVYSSSLMSYDQNALGSVSDNNDAIPADQPVQQFQLNNGTSGAAKNVFDTHQFNAGGNIQSLFILIPNEGHHGPQADEDRFLDQPFIPQNIVVNKGTNIVWFNGDVGHDHNLVVTNNSTGGSVHETGVFSQFEFRNVALNETGNYHYTDTEDYEEGFVMSGNIQVVDQSQASPSSPSTTSPDNTQSSADTIGVLMVPTQDIQTYTTDLENRGFNIDSTHNFKDLRGGQSGTGDEQTLIVWTSTGADLSTIAKNLEEFSSGLPYS